MTSVTAMLHELPEFRPHRLLRGGHAQTIAGAYLPARWPHCDAARRQVDLPDGDAIVLHERRPAGWSLCQPAALLIHGLGGSHQSGYMPRIAAKLAARGVRSYCMDLRGCGAGLHLAKRPCHAGCSDDARQALDFIMQECPESPVSVIGFSMGGNIALKMLGEMKEAVPANLRTAVAVCPPIDLKTSSRNLEKQSNWQYEYSFVRSLCRHLDQRRRAMPDVHHFVLQPRPRRLYDFDDRFTAPLSGFDGADHYYESCSSLPLLGDIRVPTLLLTAADDPIIPVGMFDVAARAPWVTLHITEYGGHLGFIGARSDDPDRRWMDWRILDWVEFSGTAAIGGAAAANR